MAAVLRGALRALALLAFLPPSTATRARGSGVELGAVVATEREAALFADLCCDWGAAPPATAQRHAPLGDVRQKASGAPSWGGGVVEVGPGSANFGLSWTAREPRCSILASARTRTVLDSIS